MQQLGLSLAFVNIHIFSIGKRYFLYVFPAICLYVEQLRRGRERRGLYKNISLFKGVKKTDTARELTEGMAQA